MDIADSIRIATSGMRAQGTRIRIVAENLANAESTGATAEDLPYRRQTVTFAAELDRASGVETVTVGRVGVDPSPFVRRHAPGHPAADAEGYVLMPNVNTLVEMMDLREAQRSYEANLRVVESARGMIQRTLDLLRG